MLVKGKLSKQLYNNIKEKRQINKNPKNFYSIIRIKGVDILWDEIKI